MSIFNTNIQNNKDNTKNANEPFWYYKDKYSYNRTGKEIIDSNYEPLLKLNELKKSINKYT